MEIARSEEEPNWVRAWAIGGLAGTADASLAGFVARLAEEDDVVVRRSAVSVMPELGDASVAPLLVRLLEDPDGTVRRHAARALARFGDLDALERLARAARQDRWRRRKIYRRAQKAIRNRSTTGVG